jgi:hypothetical protein
MELLWGCRDHTKQHQFRQLLTNHVLAHNILEVLQHLGHMVLIALDTVEP